MTEESSNTWGTNTFDEGWNKIYEEGIQVLIDYLEHGTTRHPPIINPDGSTKVVLFTNREYVDLYTTVYNMATQKDNHGRALYDKFVQTSLSHLTERVAPVIANAGVEPIQFLSVLVKKYKDYRLYTTWLGRIFQYLDRYHVTLAGTDTLERKSLCIWTKAVHVPLAETIVDSYLAVYEQDRSLELNRPMEPETTCDLSRGTGRAAESRGDTRRSADVKDRRTERRYRAHVDEMLMKEVSQIISFLDVYCDVYASRMKPKLLARTRVFYENVSNVWLESFTFAEYIQWASRTLQTEEGRCVSWGFRDTALNLQSVVTDALLVVPQTRLLELQTGPAYLLRQDAKDDLHRAFCLFGRWEGGLAPLAAAFRDHIIQEGQSIVQEKIKRMRTSELKGGKKLDEGEEGKRSRTNISFALLTSNEEIGDVAFIKSLLNLFEKNKQYLENTFKKDFNFVNAFKNAFEVFMNQDIHGYPMAAFLVTYCDKLVRRPANLIEQLPKTQDAMEVEIQGIVQLFTFLRDKDLFAEGYRHQLARRLLGAQQPPSETEKYLVARLKNECGTSFSSKLEGMLADVAAQLEDCNASFAKYLEEHPLRHPETKAAEDSQKSDIAFTVQILTTGFWPTYPFVALELPPIVQQGIDRFSEWYAQKTAYRRLLWIHTLAQAIVIGHFARDHEIVCSGFQATLLLHFNKFAPGEVVTLQQLQVATGLVDPHLKRNVKCLSGKYQLVKKVSETGFTVNTEFSSPARRFKLQVPLQEDTQQRDVIQEDRSLAIQAAIVRIMKTRRRLNHNQLIAETINHLQMFKPQPKDIKASIELLINREYVARGEEPGTQDEYTYVA